MEEKINLNLFEYFFESSSPADYAKNLISAKKSKWKQRNCSQDKRQNVRFKRQN